MTSIQIALQTIWLSILALGLIKLVIFIIVDAILWRMQPLIGLLGFILFVAYLLHWI
jgi:hypothetical protein